MNWIYPIACTNLIKNWVLVFQYCNKLLQYCIKGFFGQGINTLPRFFCHHLVLYRVFNQIDTLV
jgi:hypothetical protein